MHRCVEVRNDPVACRVNPADNRRHTGSSAWCRHTVNDRTLGTPPLLKSGRLNDWSKRGEYHRCLQDFFHGQIKGLGTKVPQQGAGMEPW